VSFVFLSVAIMLSVICFSFSGYYKKPKKKKQMTHNIIATERKTNDTKYKSNGKKNK
jgi:hypothetical protein